jgi:hypothetical protein
MFKIKGTPLRASHITRWLPLFLCCALLSACPAEKTAEGGGDEPSGGNVQSQAAAPDASDQAREMYAQIMGRYAPVGQCASADSFWEFTPTTVKNGEMTCQIHGMDTLMEQLSIDARQCVSAGSDNGTRLFYIAMPAPNILQLTGSDLQQELERCGMV